MKTATLVGALALTLSMSAAQAAPVDPHVQHFAQGAALSNMFEIEESKIILDTSKDPTLRRFAAEMIRDHGQAQHELTAAGEPSGSVTSFNFDPARKKIVDDLGLMEGKSLDNQYLTDQVEAHAGARATLEGYIASGTDPALRAYAIRTLPVVEHHQRVLEEITGKPAPM